MKISRKEKILELINTEMIRTQGELADRLNQCGFNVTQATVSRDIQELGLEKVSSANEPRHYSFPKPKPPFISDRFVKILKETITHIQSSENIIVIKTLNGCASAAAEAIDSLKIPEILGSIAGDNTIFFVIDKSENVEQICDIIKSHTVHTV